MPASIQDLIAELNPSQREAVTHGPGPLLVLAGPGSGKTRVLTHRIAYLISEGIDSGNILALTFTNKAADELTNRVERLASGNRVWTGTFHRFCSRLLRIYAPYVGLAENFTIYDSSDSRGVIKEALEAAEIRSAQYSADKIANEISRIKSAGYLPDEVGGRASSHLLAAAQRVYPIYQRMLQQNNAADFDDLLLYVVQLLRENEEIRNALAARHQYVLVDEYQDTNQSQYMILQGLCHANANLMVTGDPDQSIYGWRGATISNIFQFEKDFENVLTIRLEQNYRSTKSILRAADQLIGNNTQRKHKSLTTDNDEGVPITLSAMPTGFDEARTIAEAIDRELDSGNRNPRDFAVFYRVNWLSRVFEKELIARGIPYQVVHGVEFFSRREVKDVLSYLHLLNNPSDSLAVQRVINVPPRQIGKVTLNRLREYAQENSIPILEACRRCGLIDTISKGVAAKIAKFVSVYDELCNWREEKVEALIGLVIAHTGYREYLLRDNDEEAFQRAANVDELISAAREFDIMLDEESSLERFLEQAVLVNETDAWEHDDDRVTLMTLHAAKGLEFPCVFLVGLEQGILPHERSLQDAVGMEEERRLLFVGMTRAKEALYMSYALNRFRRGSNRPAMPSLFLMELPREEMNLILPKPDERRYTNWQVREHGASEEFDFDQRESRLDVESPEGNRANSAVTPRPIAPIMTAADLLACVDTPSGPPVDPDEFEHGMIVSHPTYGSGKIVSMSGEGKKRQATIDFFNGIQQSFRLVYSGLRPISRERR